MWRRITTHSLALTLVVGVAAGVAYMLTKESHDRRTLVQSTGVLTISRVATLYTGDEACQQPLVQAQPVSEVTFVPGNASPTPPIEVVARDVRTRRVLGRGLVRGGYELGRVQAAYFARPIPAETPFAVCLRNRGPSQVSIYGDDGHTDLCVVAPGSTACRWHFAHPTSTVTHTYLNGTPVSGTFEISLYRRRPLAVLSEVGGIMRRASAFRPGFVSPTFWWVLAGCLVLVAPAALLLGVRKLR